MNSIFYYTNVSEFNKLIETCKDIGVEYLVFTKGNSFLFVGHIEIEEKMHINDIFDLYDCLIED